MRETLKLHVATLRFICFHQRGTGTHAVGPRLKEIGYTITTSTFRTLFLTFGYLPITIINKFNMQVINVFKIKIYQW